MTTLDYITTLLIPLLYIKSLESSHSGSKESLPVSHQNSQNSKEIGIDISIFLDSSILY